jgi:hypothetical protein
MKRKDIALRWGLYHHTSLFDEPKEHFMISLMLLIIAALNP